MPDTRRCCYLSERHSSRTSARNEAKHDINNAEYLSWLDFFRKSEEGRIFLQLGVDIRSLGVTLFFPPSSPPPSPPQRLPCRQDSPYRIKRAALPSFFFFSFFFFFRPSLHLVVYLGTKRKEKEEKRKGGEIKWIF